MDILGIFYAFQAPGGQHGKQTPVFSGPSESCFKAWGYKEEEDSWGCRAEALNSDPPFISLEPFTMPVPLDATATLFVK